MPHITLAWQNDEAEANDVTYKLKQDDDTGWWFAWAFIPDLPRPTRVKGPENRGTKEDARRVAQEDAMKRSETHTAREPQVRRIRA